MKLTHLAAWVGEGQFLGHFDEIDAPRHLPCQTSTAPYAA